MIFWYICKNHSKFQLQTIMKSFFSKFSLLIFAVLISYINRVDAQTVDSGLQNKQELHEITLYAMPTLHPLDWSSPASLYNSMKDCFLKTRKIKDNYLLGHLAVKINSTLLETPMLFAMTAANKWERINLVLKEKIGFGIMGYPLEGRFETEQELNKKLAIYSKREKLAFITYRISETAAKRMIGLVNEMTILREDKKAACNYYGGAFWPRYENEGSGCSAMGMALLDVANLLPSEADEWLVKVNIPMTIIGGEMNGNKKIKNSNIRKTQTWFEGEGVPNVDYVYYQIYEPSIMFDWIMKQREQQKQGFRSLEKEGVPGLYVDYLDKPVNNDEPLIVKRGRADKFIEHYYNKRGLSTKTSTMTTEVLP